MSEATGRTPTVIANQSAVGLRGFEDEHRRFIFWHAIVGAAVVNLILNTIWALSEAKPAEP
jgi:hypothetical protein